MTTPTTLETLRTGARFHWDASALDAGENPAEVWVVVEESLGGPNVMVKTEDDHGLRFNPINTVPGSLLVHTL